MKKDDTKVMKCICIIGYVLVVAMVCYMTIFHKIKVDLIPVSTVISSMTILELICIAMEEMRIKKFKYGCRF